MRDLQIESKDNLVRTKSTAYPSKPTDGEAVALTITANRCLMCEQKTMTKAISSLPYGSGNLFLLIDRAVELQKNFLKKTYWTKLDK